MNTFFQDTDALEPQVEYMRSNEEFLCMTFIQPKQTADSFLSPKFKFFY